MSTYLTSLTVTPLADFISMGNKFHLAWTVTGSDITYFEVLRYVAPLSDIGSSTPPETSFTSVITCDSGTLLYDDFLTGITDPDGVYSTSQVIDQILHTQRKLIYLVKLVYLAPGIGRGVTYGQLPYVITTQNRGWVISWAARTEVIYNTLYEEGSAVWATFLDDVYKHPEDNGSEDPRDSMAYPSRTTIDNVNNKVWVSDRTHACAFRLNSINGEIESKYNVGRGRDTRGLTIAQDGDALLGGNFHEIYKLSKTTTTGEKSVAAVIGPGTPEYGAYGISRNINNNNIIGVVWKATAKPHNLLQVDLSTGTIIDGVVSTAAGVGGSYDKLYSDTYGYDDLHWSSAFGDSTTNIKIVSNPVASHATPTLRDTTSTGAYSKYTSMCIDKQGATSSNYNIWTTMLLYGDTAGRVYKFTWDGATLTPAGHYTVGQDVRGVACDSENNIWAVGGGGDDHLYKLYQLATGPNLTVYPSGGECRYPQSTFANWTKTSNTNDIYCDYLLTRDRSSMGVAMATDWDNAVSDRGPSGSADTPICPNVVAPNTYRHRIFGITTTPAAAYDWVITKGHGLNNLIGRRVYPNYVALPSYYAIDKSANTSTWISHAKEEFYALSYEYSDFTGFIAAQSDSPPDTVPITSTIYSSPLYTDPSFDNPGVDDMQLIGINSTPVLNDGIYWQNQINNTETIKTSGYDDLTVRCTPGPYTAGTFILSGYKYDFGDRIQDIGGQVNSNPNLTNNPFQDYTYHDPSRSGKPSERRNGYPGETNGTYYVNVTGYFNPNIYLGSDPVTIKNLVAGTATVWERWPTSQFYLTPRDGHDIRHLIWGEHIIRPVGDNGLTPWNPNRIISGTDPVSAMFNDMSIARTWPLCSWYIDFGDRIRYPAYFTSLGYVNTAYIETYDPLYSPRDASTLHESMTSHLYCRPGIYYATLFTQASNTGTYSADLNTMVIAASQEVRVYELEPTINFLTVAVSTVSSNYHDDATTSIESHLLISQPPVLNTLTFISGYSPNLTITWMESCTPHSFPICAYRWNFGDYYNELLNITAVDVTGIIDDYPIWTNDRTNHIITHTYTMPGIYDVTLCANTSGSNSSTASLACCARSLYVYVEEINPQACFEVSLSSDGGFSNIPVSGDSPLTVYFNPSCTIPGSFPICRMDWDFDDGSPITTITRYPSTENVFGVYAYPSDPLDPRNIIVSHTFNRNLISQDSTYTVMLSVYACNTNTMDSTSGYGSDSYNVGPINTPPVTSTLGGKKHLIESRLFNTDNNLMLVFEGENQPITYNVLISGI